MSEPALYAEKPRTYASLWVFTAILGVGVAFDATLGGARAHLIGWIVAFVLVIGVDFLIVYAVRSEKALRLTAAELRVGDDAVGRAEIVAVASGVDDADLPVLGWPGGRPRTLKGLTIRLFDGQDVVVPTRFPDRLRAALAVDSVHGPAGAQGVRAAARADLPLLEDVDLGAEAIFRAAGYELPDISFDAARLAKAKAVFVAGRPPVGYVHVEELDGCAHIVELAVVPKWMRQGIGSELLERACEWARQHDYPGVTLTTYADVPWNGPFYAARGFVEVNEPTPGLIAARARERELGLDAVTRRIAMRRDLTSPTVAPVRRDTPADPPQRGHE